MTKVEYLSLVTILDRKIAKKRQRLTYYREMASSPSGVSYDEIRVSKSRNTEAPFVGLIDKAIELEEEIKALEKKRDDIRFRVASAIEVMENEDYKNLLVLKYLKNFSWAQICNELYVSRWTVKRWHDEAIEQLEIKI